MLSTRCTIRTFSVNLPTDTTRRFPLELECPQQPKRKVVILLKKANVINPFKHRHGCTGLMSAFGIFFTDNYKNMESYTTPINLTPYMNLCKDQIIEQWHRAACLRTFCYNIATALRTWASVKCVIIGSDTGLSVGTSVKYGPNATLLCMNVVWKMATLKWY